MNYMFHQTSFPQNNYHKEYYTEPPVAEPEQHQEVQQHEENQNTRIPIFFTNICSLYTILCIINSIMIFFCLIFLIMICFKKQSINYQMPYDMFNK